MGWKKGWAGRLPAVCLLLVSWAMAESDIYKDKILHIYGPWPKLDMPFLIMNGLSTTDNGNLLRADSTLGDNWYTGVMPSDSWGGINILGGQIQNGKDSVGDWGRQYGATGLRYKNANGTDTVVQWRGNGSALDLFPPDVNEIWMVPNPEDPNLAPVTLLHRPYVLRVLNPEDWTLGAPQIVVNGAAPVQMNIDPVRCGWFWYMFLAEPPYQVSFVNSQDGETYGSKLGYEDDTPWLLDPNFNSVNEAWLLPEEDGLEGLGLFSSEDPMVDGDCSYEVAAIIRDFNGETHPDFIGGQGNGKTLYNCVGDGLLGNDGKPNGLVRGIVENTLNADRKPVQTVPAKCFKQFSDIFNDTPGTNTTACSDIVMSKTADGLWEYDAFNDLPYRGYFPIDDLVSDQNIQYLGGVAPPGDGWTDDTPADSVSLTFKDADGKDYTPYGFDWGYKNFTEAKHNFNFCFETHADFVYAKGQTFSFRGDDDVWVFLAGRLALDLGGLHVPMPGKVVLDTLHDANGDVLVPGKTYPFDFFFCERSPNGSNIRIKTSMYFKQSKELFFTKNSDGSYLINKSEGGGGSCAALSGDATDTLSGSELSGKLLFKLYTSRGVLLDAIPSTTDLDSNLVEGMTVYGGITIGAGTFAIDTAKLSGLAPGRYKLVVQAGSAKESITFKVAGNITFWSVNGKQGSAALSAKPAADMLAGRMVPFEVIKGTLEGIDSTDASFSLTIPEGLLVYLDSLGTKPVLSSDVVSTGDDGIVRLWATGSRRVAADTATYALGIKSIKVTPLSLRFHMPRIAFVADTTKMWPDTLAVPMARLGGDLNFSFMNHATYLIAYDPVDGSLCEVCKDTLTIDTALTTDSLVFSVDGGPALVMQNGRATVMVRALAKIVDGVFVIRGPAAQMEATWSPINLEPPPVPLPQLAAMFDKNADGVADSVYIGFDRSVVAKNDSMPDFIVVRWPSSNPDSAFYYGRGRPTPELTSNPEDSTLVKKYPADGENQIPGFAYNAGKSLGLPFAYEGVNTRDLGEADVWFTFEKDGATLQVPMSIALQDSMPPVVASARLGLATSSDKGYDTLRVAFSEPVDTTGLGLNIFEFRLLSSEKGAAPRILEPALMRWNAAGDSVVMFFAVSANVERLQGNLDSIRISTNSVSAVVKDKRGNVRSLQNHFVLIEGKKSIRIISIPFVRFDPASLSGRDGVKPVTVGRMPLGTTLKSFQESLLKERGATLGHVVGIDMAEVMADYAAVYLSRTKRELVADSVILHYEVGYYTNLGGLVAHDNGLVSCGDDAVFGGDCTGKGRGFVFLGWNLVSDEERLVSTGAYVARLHAWVEIPGIGAIGNTDLSKTEIWGVVRAKGEASFK